MTVVLAGFGGIRLLKLMLAVEYTTHEEPLEGPPSQTSATWKKDLLPKCRSTPRLYFDVPRSETLPMQTAINAIAPR